MILMSAYAYHVLLQPTHITMTELSPTAKLYLNKKTRIPGNSSSLHHACIQMANCNNNFSADVIQEFQFKTASDELNAPEIMDVTRTTWYVTNSMSTKAQC